MASSRHSRRLASKRDIGGASAGAIATAATTRAGGFALGLLASGVSAAMLGRSACRSAGTEAPTPTGWPINFAHRGGRKIVPENTIEGFEEAIKLGPVVLELDARVAADGEVVVIHDETVDRTTDGTGEVARMTLAELQRLDAGHRFTPAPARRSPGGARA